jgi:hypothetical protein
MVKQVGAKFYLRKIMPGLHNCLKKWRKKRKLFFLKHLGTQSISIQKLAKEALACIHDKQYKIVNLWSKTSQMLQSHLI